MIKSFQALTAISLLSILLLQPVMAASTKKEVQALQEDVKALKQGQAAMQKDLADIKKLLEGGAKPQAAAKQFEPKEISVAGAPFLGDADAKVTLVEYSDYQCPFCNRHHVNTMPELIKNYVDTGKVKFVMREFPLTSLHPRAVAASLAALCSGDQGKYWEMQDVLFKNQRQMDDAQIRSYAESIGLDTDSFVACMDEGKYNEQVQKDLAEGRGLGISGTPSFAVGLTDPEDSNKLNVTNVLRGAKSYDSFVAAIEALLKPAAHANLYPTQESAL
jgi:protein-disulfide isomerase